MKNSENTSNLEEISIILAEPRGFCAGVERAIQVVKNAIRCFGSPIYVLHEIVHNKHVVKTLLSEGAIFVENIEDIPENSILIFSAHGVSKNTHKLALSRKLTVFDATCPLVSKVHMEIKKLANYGYEFIMIGHQGHPEVVGTMGQLPGKIHLVETIKDIERVEILNKNKIGLVTQTTLSLKDTQIIIEAIKKHFPHIREPKQKDICYATENRQYAVETISYEVELMIIIGSENSSNASRLFELSSKMCKASYMIDSCADFDPSWMHGVKKLGISSGASTPECIIDSLIQEIRKYRRVKFLRNIRARKELIKFPLPKGLKIDS